MNKQLIYLIIVLLLTSIFYQCNKTTKPMNREEKAVFLHHSTGMNVWKGNVSKYAWKLFKTGDLQKWIKKYNKSDKTNFFVEELSYPVQFDNMPYDYYNLWVKNGNLPEFQGNATLEKLTKEYGLIIWKHCFPVSELVSDTVAPSFDSNLKTLAGYKLQYQALKEKMLAYPETKFLVWTGPVHVKSLITEEQASMMKEFVNWVKNEWDQKGDNIFLWDFYELETEGGLYLKDEYAYSKNDSHPAKIFSSMASACFGQRIVDVMQGKGDQTSLTGK